MMKYNVHIYNTDDGNTAVGKSFEDYEEANDFERKLAFAETTVFVGVLSGEFQKHHVQKSVQEVLGEIFCNWEDEYSILFSKYISDFPTQDNGYPTVSLEVLAPDEDVSIEIKYRNVEGCSDFLLAQLFAVHYMEQIVLNPTSDSILRELPLHVTTEIIRDMVPTFDMAKVKKIIFGKE